MSVCVYHYLCCVSIIVRIIICLIVFALIEVFTVNIDLISS